MGHPIPRVVADDDLEAAILAIIDQLKRRKVVPTNRIVKALQAEFQNSGMSDEHLALLVKEAATGLGLVPVFDPEPPPAPTRYRFGGRR